MKRWDQFLAPGGEGQEEEDEEKTWPGELSKAAKSLEREQSKPGQTGWTGRDLYYHKGSTFKEPVLCHHLEICFLF